MMARVSKALFEHLSEGLQSPVTILEYKAKPQNMIDRIINKMTEFLMKVKNSGRPEPKNDSSILS